MNTSKFLRYAWDACAGFGLAIIILMLVLFGFSTYKNNFFEGDLVGDLQLTQVPMTDTYDITASGIEDPLVPDVMDWMIHGGYVYGGYQRPEASDNVRCSEDYLLNIETKEVQFFCDHGNFHDTLVVLGLPKYDMSLAKGPVHLVYNLE